jgi:hypothetical protein
MGASHNRLPARAIIMAPVSSGQRSLKLQQCFTSTASAVVTCLEARFGSVSQAVERSELEPARNKQADLRAVRVDVGGQRLGTRVWVATGVKTFPSHAPPPPSANCVMSRRLADKIGVRSRLLLPRLAEPTLFAA